MRVCGQRACASHATPFLRSSREIARERTPACVCVCASAHSRTFPAALGCAAPHRTSPVVTALEQIHARIRTAKGSRREPCSSPSISFQCLRPLLCVKMSGKYARTPDVRGGSLRYKLQSWCRRCFASSDILLRSRLNIHAMRVNQHSRSSRPASRHEMRVDVLKIPSHTFPICSLGHRHSCRRSGLLPQPPARSWPRSH